jgi:hypothetical protein
MLTLERIALLTHFPTAELRERASKFTDKELVEIVEMMGTLSLTRVLAGEIARVFCVAPNEAEDLAIVQMVALRGTKVN